MGMNLWKEEAPASPAKNDDIVVTNTPRAKGDKWQVTHAAVGGRVLHLTFKCPGQN